MDKQQDQWPIFQYIGPNPIYVDRLRFRTSSKIGAFSNGYTNNSKAASLVRSVAGLWTFTDAAAAVAIGLMLTGDVARRPSVLNRYWVDGPSLLESSGLNWSSFYWIVGSLIYRLWVVAMKWSRRLSSLGCGPRKPSKHTVFAIFCFRIENC